MEPQPRQVSVNIAGADLPRSMDRQDRGFMYTWRLAPAAAIAEERR